MCETHPKMQQTNPRYSSFTQTTFTAGDVEQFVTSRKKLDLKAKRIDLSENMFSDQFRQFDWSNHQNARFKNLTSEAVWNTFRYLFYKFKKGIFVSIVDDRLVNFLPFLNTQYVNEFWPLLRVDPKQYSSVQDFLNKTDKLSGFKPVTAIALDEWQANNSMFRYEKRRFEGQTNIETLKDMFQTCALKRQVPDVEFFLNRRDFPLITNGEHMYEPYFHLFGRTTPLISHQYDHYTPIFSCSSSDYFADVLIPTFEDWARASFQATGKMFPECVKHPKIVPTPWDSKKPVAVFRGSTTGSGTTSKTNQRLAALEIAESKANAGRLDVGITKWNLRPRKFEGQEFLSTINRKSYPVAQKLTLQEQSSQFKYILTLEGHVAAFRLSYELSSGSVVLLADSQWNMWINKFLIPWEHFVPVKRDLSDLLEKVDWCRANDERCQQIAQNAKDFYDKYLGIDGILDYLQLLLIFVARNSGHYKYLKDPLETSLAEENLWLDRIKFSDKIFPFPITPTPRCIGKLNATLEVFRSKSESDIVFVKNLFKSKKVIVDSMRTNGFFMARKHAIDDLKKKEQDHEAFIGLNAINSIVSKCPNFPFIYGRAKGSNKDLFVEQISGQTLFEWLNSPDYNFKDFVSILIQINLALTVAQQMCGFIHYDLYPWNIILQKLKEPIAFDYAIGKLKALRYFTSIVPIMIDFGKSRAIVFEQDNGLIDHGMIELFKPNSIYDTLTLLFSTMYVLGDKLTDQEKLLMTFFWEKIVGIKGRLEHLRKFGALFDKLDNIDPFQFTPMTFVDYLMKYVKDNRLRMAADTYICKIERGNQIVEQVFMSEGNRKTAILEAIVRTMRQTIPMSTNQVEDSFIKTILKRKVSDFEEMIATQDEQVKKKWLVAKKFLLESRQKYETTDVVVDIPNVKYLQMDSEMSPEFVSRHEPQMKKTDTDWLQTWIVCTEGAMLDQRLNLFGLFELDSFKLFNSIASNNTCIKIAQQNLE